MSAYFSYPAELRPAAVAGLFYARKTFGELVTALAADFYRRRAGQAGEISGTGTPTRQHRAIPHFDLVPFADQMSLVRQSSGSRRRARPR